MEELIISKQQNATTVIWNCSHESKTFFLADRNKNKLRKL